MTSRSQANFSTTEQYSPIHIYIPHQPQTQTDAGKINRACKKSFTRFKHKFQNHIPASLLNYLPSTVPLFSYLWDSTLTGYNLQNLKPFILFILKHILLNKYKLFAKAWSHITHRSAKWSRFSKQVRLKGTGKTAESWRQLKHET